MAKKEGISIFKAGIILTVFLGIVLGFLAIVGVISTSLIAMVFAAILLGMLVLHGGGLELASGLSDHEGYQRQLEEEEQRKAEEEEYYGDAYGDSYQEEPESYDYDEPDDEYQY